MEVSRRNFVMGAGAVVSAAAIAGLAGCSSEESSAAEGETSETTETTTDTSTEDIEPSSTIDCDICVVGAGLSGLVAAVQAAEDGVNVVVLESSDTTGGAAVYGVEGSFAVDSRMSKEAGIEVDIKEILASEMEQSQWRADGLSWLEMMENSGENMDWLLDQGVKIAVVDNYHNKDFYTFHWYEDGVQNGYIDPMTARLDDYGVQVEYNTAAKQLIQDSSGQVTGVYAQNDSNEWIQVNAKAVILATGGFGANPELASKLGYQEQKIMSVASPYIDGSGHNMAIAAGAHDMAELAADNAGSIVHSFGFSYDNLSFCMEPTVVWINEKCERFYKEDNCVVNLSLANPPKWNQKDAYILFDQAIFDAATADSDFRDSGDSLPAVLENSLSEGASDVWRADTLRELAEAAGLDPDQLESFVEDYNRMCANGYDELWEKDPQYMVPIETGPFYLCNPGIAMFCTVGGVCTNRNAQACTKNYDPIDGLYVVGVEGCMLYRNVYTIGTPGSCSGNSINTARVAVKHAIENYV